MTHLMYKSFKDSLSWYVPAVWKGILQNTNTFKNMRYNFYFSKANPPAYMVTDVMHFEIHDSVFNNFVGRNFSYIL